MKITKLDREMAGELNDEVVLPFFTEPEFTEDLVETVESILHGNPQLKSVRIETKNGRLILSRFQRADPTSGPWVMKQLENLESFVEAVKRRQREAEENERQARIHAVVTRARELGFPTD